jgi:hypothetical protein
MTKRTWFDRLVERLGGGKEGRFRAAGSSKHGRGKTPALNARAERRKAQRKARKAQRGK